MALSRRSFIKRALGAAGAVVVAPALMVEPVGVSTAVEPQQPTMPLDEIQAAWNDVGPTIPGVDYQAEMQRVMREAAINNAAVIEAMVRNSLVSRGYAMASMGFATEETIAVRRMLSGAGA